MDLFQTLGLGDKPAEENVVFFAIYPDDAQQDLELLRLDILKDVLPFLKAYIWHKDPFEIHNSSSHAPPWAKQRRRQGKTHAISSDLSCLWGATQFGDNIEDEWVVVALLLQLSASHPSLSIQVWDNDGDFMLIEAAYALPKWLKPEVAANRVWLRAGHLHLIPQPSARWPSLPPFPTLEQALNILKSPPAGLTTLAPRIEAAVASRVQGLLQSALQQVHVAEAALPVRLAAALAKDPQLIAAAVEAFFYRDADDMRAAARMTHFPLRQEAMVTSPVRMSRCQHAQLLQQRFAPPRGLARPSASQQPSEHRAAELGLKVAAGFEILWARTARVGGLPGQVQGEEGAAAGLAAEEGQPAASAAAVECQQRSLAPGASGLAVGIVADGGCLTEQQLQGLPAWRAYLTSLERSGYFEGNMAGSARYKVLLAQAIREFCGSPLLPRSTQQVADPVLRALRAIRAAEGEAAVSGLDVQQWVEQQAAVVAAAGVRLHGDDEQWVQSQAETLDQELARRQAELESYHTRRSGKGKDTGPLDSSTPDGGGSSRTAQEQVVEAADLVSRFTTFVSAMSGHEGAELPESERPVALDMVQLLGQLKQTLGMAAGEGMAGTQQKQHQAAAEGHAMEEDEDWSDSSEGSSFFSHEGSDGSDEEEGVEAADGEAGSSAGFIAELERQMREACQPTQGRHPASSTLEVAAAPAQRARGQAGGLPRKLQEMQEAWEVHTATDSDDAGSSAEDELSVGDHLSGSDEEEAGSQHGPGRGQRQAGNTGFFGAYSQALEEQLRDTKMADTFERAHATAATAAHNAGDPSLQAANGATGRVEELDPGVDVRAGAGQGPSPSSAALQPVDLDMNLVRNLLRSAAAQHGLAGPASNLAGMLGLDLPQGMDEEDIGRL